MLFLSDTQQSPHPLGSLLMIKLLSLGKVAAFATILLLPLNFAQAADHLEAPAVRMDGSTDINDLFLFQSPTNANNSVMILTVNPFAGSGNSGTTFNENASYQFQFDNTGDAVANVTYSTTFSPAVAGVQTYQVQREGVTIASGTTGTTTNIATGGQVTAGNFDDPFFFDFNGFNDGFNFTGDNTFAGADVSAIVLEVPSADFIAGSNNVGAQAVTEAFGLQVDRIGRPAIATALIPTGRKDEFNAGNPATDFATFGEDVNAVIASLSDQDNADALTGVLLPDLLTFDVSSADGFLNGRRLEDDVIDAALQLLTGNPDATDFADNDSAFGDVFPFLAQANAIPEPSSSVAILMLAIGGVLRRSRRS